MATWERGGTISVTNNSTTVTGSGTSFIDKALAGYALLVNGEIWEIERPVSETELQLATPYIGSTLSGQPYAIIPTKGVLTYLADQFAGLQALYQAGADGALAGRFGDGTVGAPAISFLSNTGMGLYRVAANQLGFATNGIRRLLLTTSAFQMDVPVTGTAVHDGTETTAGKLLKVNSFGLGNTLNSVQITVADDAVGVVTPAVKGGWLAVSDLNSTAGSFPALPTFGMFLFDAGSSPGIQKKLDGGGNIAAASGTNYTGTTGAHGSITVNVSGNGNIQVENRSGATRTFTLTVF